MKPLIRTHWSLIAIVMIVLAIGLLPSSQSETPLQRAHRICNDCGMYELEIVELIEQVKSSGLTPKEAIELWKQTAESDAVELCRDCVDAVIEAVELER